MLFVPWSLLPNADVPGVNLLLVLASHAKPIQQERNAMKCQETKTQQFKDCAATFISADSKLTEIKAI